MLHASRNHELPLKIFIYLSKTLQNVESWKVAIETTLNLRTWNLFAHFGTSVDFPGLYKIHITTFRFTQCPYFSRTTSLGRTCVARCSPTWACCPSSSPPTSPASRKAATRWAQSLVHLKTPLPSCRRKLFCRRKDYMAANLPFPVSRPCWCPLMILFAGGAGQEEGAAGAATAQEVGRSAGQERWQPSR